MTCNALPLSIRHLHPCISKALMSIEGLSWRISALRLEVTGSDRSTAKCCYLHIVVSDSVVFGRFRCSKRVGLAGDFPIACSIYELVPQQRGDQVRVIW